MVAGRHHGDVRGGHGRIRTRHRLLQLPLTAPGEAGVGVGYEVFLGLSRASFSFRHSHLAFPIPKSSPYALRNQPPQRSSRPEAERRHLLRRVRKSRLELEKPLGNHGSFLSGWSCWLLHAPHSHGPRQTPHASSPDSTPDKARYSLP